MRVLALALVALAPAASAQVTARLADLRLATAVRLALVADARTRPLDLAVTARDGAVAVAGAVPPPDQRAAAEVARRVPGVRSLSGLGAGDVAAAPTPVEARPERDVGAAYHTVERGDTLFSLARRYGTTVEAIRSLNRLPSSGIQIGQRLRVR